MGRLGPRHRRMSVHSTVHLGSWTLHPATQVHASPLSSKAMVSGHSQDLTEMEYVMQLHMFGRAQWLSSRACESFGPAVVKTNLFSTITLLFAAIDSDSSRLSLWIVFLVLDCSLIRRSRTKNTSGSIPQFLVSPLNWVY